MVSTDYYDHLYKGTRDLNFYFSVIISVLVILVGDAFVGKTHIISRYIHGGIPKHINPTLGVEFSTKNVILGNGGIVKAQIWDTAGTEKYKAIIAAYIYIYIIL